MFKKIEVWILCLVILLGVISTTMFGALVKQEVLGANNFLKKNNVGWIGETALFIAEIPINLKTILSRGGGVSLSKKELDAADNRVEDRSPGLAGFNGVPIGKDNYLLLSRYDGDSSQGVVELVDLKNFRILHSWNPDVDAFNDLVDQIDEFENLDRDDNDHRKMLMHPKLTKDGGLLFGWNSPLRKIDSCSKLVFQNTHNVFHHSIETDIDGNIWVPGYLYPHTLPIEKVGEDVNSFFDDAIVKMSPDGEVLYEKSVAQIFIENDLEYLLFSVGATQFNVDPIHLNDIQPVNFDGEFWKKGDVFLSLGNQSMIVLYRPSSDRIVWKHAGPFFFQHDVDILDNHRISIFNNNTKNTAGGLTVNGHSEVIVYDFKTGKTSLYLNKSLVNENVKTTTQGRSQILPNGDLLIEETNYARTIYFNADGSVSWSHLNRAKDGNLYRVGWSRILYTEDDINTVENFLENRVDCNG